MFITRFLLCFVFFFIMLFGAALLWVVIWYEEGLIPAKSIWPALLEAYGEMWQYVVHG